MNKKYNFDDILKEYNVEYKCNYSLSSNVYSVTIIHTTGNNTFNVTYLKRSETIKNTKSLLDFIYYYITNSIKLKYGDLLNIILSKERNELDLKIEIWPPSKIRYAYLQSNYVILVGNLGSSCMRGKEMQKALNFYVGNKVRIVVLIDNKNKIHARALLWDNVKSTKLKRPFTYLDRVYARSDALLPLFYDLAKESNWKRYPSTTVNKMDKSYYKESINTKGLCHIAYNDTFRYLYCKDNLLTSSPGLVKTKHSDYIVLDVHNNEAYYPTLDPNRVREVISSNYISKKDAVFIKKYDGWVLKKNIANIKGDYYSVFDKEIVKTTADGYILKENSVAEIITNDIIDKNKATQSTKYKGFIHKSNIVYIKDELYHKLDADIICFNSKWYHTSQCFVNYDRGGMNKELATQTGYIYHPQDYTPYWRRTKVDDKNSKYAGLSRKGNPIPKECVIIAYDLVYNPIIDDIEYQEVYLTDRKNIIQLITGELIVNSSENKKHLKKFNNKWYIKQDFEPPNKNQLTLFGDKK